MAGRRLLSETEFAASHGPHWRDAASARRRAVLRETVAAFEGATPRDRYLRLALGNVQRWREACPPGKPGAAIMVLPGDWGEVTRSLTARFGATFAVLVMANAVVPGGAYVEGAIAQEENMFRRTDCHFHIGPDQFDAATERYMPRMTDLLSGRDGRVHLDVETPRVCIRGPEDRTREDLGYAWLADDEVFPFLELRAAAQDLRGGRAFDAAEGRRRIAAQLDTLCAHGIRHAVLSAFGCGAFANPADEVASLYREEIEARRDRFDVLAFAIFQAGYGPDNYAPFARVLAQDG